MSTGMTSPVAPSQMSELKVKNKYNIKDFSRKKNLQEMNKTTSFNFNRATNVVGMSLESALNSRIDFEDVNKKPSLKLRLNRDMLNQTSANFSQLSPQ